MPRPGLRKDSAAATHLTQKLGVDNALGRAGPCRTRATLARDLAMSVSQWLSVAHANQLSPGPMPFSRHNRANPNILRGNRASSAHHMFSDLRRNIQISSWFPVGG